jgi:hypothetical protein
MSHRHRCRYWPIWTLACVMLFGCKPGEPPEEKKAADLHPVAEAVQEYTERIAPPPPPPVVDDRGAPAAFPADDEVPGWRKRTGVRVAVGEEMAHLMSAESAARLVGFQLRQLSWAEYEYEDVDPPAAATVFLLETASLSDAFGVSTVLRDVSADALFAMTIAHPIGWTICGASGRCVAVLACEWEEGSEAGALLRHLQEACAEPGKIVVPLDALPSTDPSPNGLWLVRRTSALAAAAPDLPLEHADEIDQLLGLGQVDAWLLAASYPAPGGKRDNVVWVCSYPSADDASAAYLTYRNLMERRAPEWARSHFLKSPIGRYLLGTWTIEEESLAPLLDRIAARLEDMS